MLNVDKKIANINFKQNDKPKWAQNVSYSANQFLLDGRKLEERRVNGDFFSKNMGSITGTYGGCGLILGGELVLLNILKNANKKGMCPDLKQVLRKKILIALAGILAVGIGIMTIVQRWQNKLMKEDSPLPAQYLKEFGQDTSAKLSKNNFRSMSLAASYNQLNGVIEVNKNYLYDPVGKLFVKKYMKHELQHARQFEMIAASENGIEKLNYAIFKNTARAMKNNPLALAQIEDVIKDVNNDAIGKYDNIIFSNGGAEINFKDYIKGLDILLNNEDAKPEELPIIVDVDHYKKAIEKRGPLSDDEKIKAEEYYQAMLKYPVMAGINVINPFSGYRSNVLEKEARKSQRSKTGRI